MTFIATTTEAMHMAIDRVCGMTVEPKTAAGSASYQGKTYWFWSPHFLAKFNEDPDKCLGNKESAADRIASHRRHGGPRRVAYRVDRRR